MTTVKKQAAEQTAPEVITLNIYQKLHLAKQSMGKVIKNANNPHFKRSYARAYLIRLWIATIATRKRW
jgi:hypothetical protein